MLELKDVTKEYCIGKTTFRALDGISLKISDGEFVSIMGPSGSGKSTLLHFLGFLDKPTRGEVYIDGMALSGMSSDDLADVRNGRIGFVFQSFNLAPTLSVAKNVELPLTIGGKSKKERKERVTKLLSMVGLLDKWDSLPSQLSGGEKQRVAMARALAQNPKIILADEPTGNLDSKSGKEILDGLHDLWKNHGMTIVMITHEPVVAAYAERTIYIRDGRVEADRKQKARKASVEEIKIKR
ncbi:ABC transporter ATP-binding protein [Candidatus Micrarchaeota archaeon]|nr:ABC transporter ATP-binding protein [Candidatus Micrarchaeota archaeon]